MEKTPVGLSGIILASAQSNSSSRGHSHLIQTYQGLKRLKAERPEIKMVLDRVAESKQPVMVMGYPIDELGATVILVSTVALASVVSKAIDSGNLPWPTLTETST